MTIVEMIQLKGSWMDWTMIETWCFGRDNKKNSLVFHKPWHNIRLGIVWNFRDVIVGMRALVEIKWN